jgi:hypothetical protein
MALLQINGNMRLFGGFATKKVTIAMLLPSYMVMVASYYYYYYYYFILYFILFFGPYGLVH